MARKHKKKNQRLFRDAKKRERDILARNSGCTLLHLDWKRRRIIQIRCSLSFSRIHLVAARPNPAITHRWTRATRTDANQIAPKIEYIVFTVQLVCLKNAIIVNENENEHVLWRCRIAFDPNAATGRIIAIAIWKWAMVKRRRARAGYKYRSNRFMHAVM